MEVLRRRPVIEAYEVVKEVKFYLDGLTEAVKVKVYKVHIPNNSNLDGRFSYETSHHIKTPTQAGPYHTSRPWSDSIEGAVNDAISGIQMFLGGAVEQGHQPEDSWLIGNSDF